MARILMVMANAGSGGMQAQMALQSELLLARGHEVHLATGGGNGPAVSGALSHDLPHFSPRSVTFVRAVSRLVSRLNPDVIHAHGLRLTPSMMWCAPGRRVLVECHGLDPRLIPSAPWRTLRAAKRAGIRIAACGEGPASIMRPELGHVDVINNLLPPSRDSLDPRVAFSLHAEDCVAIWPARFSEQKGHERLIDLVAAVDEPRLKVICVGDGPLRAHIEQVVIDHGLHDQIICGDYSPEAGRWLAGSDLFIMPSWWEGQPTVGLEAIRAQLPILSLNLVGDEDILSPEIGVRETRVEVAADILREWITTPDARPHYGPAADSILSRHLADRVTADLESAYGVEL